MLTSARHWHRSIVQFPPSCPFHLTRPREAGHDLMRLSEFCGASTFWGRIEPRWMFTESCVCPFDGPRRFAYLYLSPLHALSPLANETISYMRIILAFSALLLQSITRENLIASFLCSLPSPDIHQSFIYLLTPRVDGHLQISTKYSFARSIRWVE